jgi:MFS-type transporter involved in bile tolerance (Atg22 family)
MNMAGQAASFLTAVTFGYIVTATGSYNAPLVPMAILSIVAGLLWLAIDPTKPLIAEPSRATVAAS